MELLEKHFDVAFSASDSVEKLRELILTFAMQGKLVPQQAKDLPVNELTQKIDIARQRLIEEGVVKKSKSSPKIKMEEIPYELPEGWEWVRLNEVIDVRDGTHNTPKYVESGYPLVTSKNLYTGTLNLENVKYISEEDHSEIIKRSRVDVGDILFAMIGSIGNPVIVSTDVEFSIKNVALLKFYVKDSPYGRYLYYFLLRVQEDMKAKSSGAVQSFVSLGYLRKYLFPLPPLEEQHRIVAKIDQLMARCDELEKLRVARDRLQITVHKVACDRLLTAKDPDTFTQSWQFITQHFNELYSVKENVTELRKTILQLAVMGKLVPQDPNDSSVNDLFAEINLQKQRLIDEKMTRKSKPLPDLTREDFPFSIPNSWQWSKFEDLVDIGSGVTKGRKLAGRKLIALPYLRVANVQRGYLDLDVIKEIEIPKDEIDKYVLHQDDLLLTEGGDWDKVGRTAIWNSEITPCIHQNHVFKARRYIQKQNVHWLACFLNSAPARDYFAGASKQTTNLASINKTQLRRCPVPIPPLPEQRRIVAKVDQLMTLCDQLEQQIDKSTQTQTALLNAVTAQV